MPSSPQYRRFSLSDRAEHWLLFASFTVLAVTGLVQQHIDWPVYNAIIRVLGGIETTRIIHHVAAVVLMFETIYHIGVLTYKFFVLGTRPGILPGKQDAVNAFQAVRYGLGLTEERPQEGHFTFAEKLEYWAVVWGTLVMGITGFMLWNPINTTRLLPGSFIPAAKAAHGKEALLAVLAIILWHLYTVHLRHLNLSMFTGKLSEEEMEDEHRQALADLKAGKIEARPDPETISRRRRIWFPAYGVATLAMMAGVFFFIFSEKTAIATLPPAERVTVFAPLSPTPFPTQPPTFTPVPPSPTPEVPTITPTPEGVAPAATPGVAGTVTWQSEIGALMQTRCGACHSSASKMGGLDLTSYQAALKGGNSGPGVVPGEPSSSLVVSRQAGGQHPGMFTAEELQRVIHWIEQGAPEK